MLSRCGRGKCGRYKRLHDQHPEHVPGGRVVLDVKSGTGCEEWHWGQHRGSICVSFLFQYLHSSVEHEIGVGEIVANLGFNLHVDLNTITIEEFSIGPE